MKKKQRARRNNSGGYDERLRAQVRSALATRDPLELRAAMRALERVEGPGRRHDEDVLGNVLCDVILTDLKAAGEVVGAELTKRGYWFASSPPEVSCEEDVAAYTIQSWWGNEIWIGLRQRVSTGSWWALWWGSIDDAVAHHARTPGEAVAWLLTEPWRRETRANPEEQLPFLFDVPPSTVTPDLTSYDHIIIAFSGGKDSLAALVRVLELAKAQGRDLRSDGAIELWHHDVDSPDSKGFMDWPVTHGYVKAVGDALGIPVYFSWRIGGFARELMRKGSLTAATRWEEPGGKIGQSGGTAGKLGTRYRFPQVTADLKTRWCSPYLKIMVCDAAIRGQARFKGRRTLVVSGERAEESAGRAKYKTFEPDRTHARGRHVDRWRPVHAWTTAQVWDAIRRWGVVPHPAYRAGFGRVSCAFCIFGSPDQWATLRELLPSGYDRIVELERRFGVTIQRSETVEQRTARGRAYAILNADVEEGRRLAVQREYDAPVLTDPAAWVMPAGAFAEGAGPT